MSIDPRIDSFFRILLFINSKYAPIASRSHNLTYLSRLSLLTDEDVRVKTVVSICKQGIDDILATLDVPFVPPFHYKRLVNLIKDILKDIKGSD